MITKYGKQLHLEELTQMRLIKHALVTSSRQDHVSANYQSAYGHQAWQDGDLP